MLAPQLTAAERVFYRDHLLLGGPQRFRRQAGKPFWPSAFDDTLKHGRLGVVPARMYDELSETRTG